jgi:hypothetical protein
MILMQDELDDLEELQALNDQLIEKWELAQLFARVCQVFLDAPVDGRTVREAVESVVPWAEWVDAVDRGRRFWPHDEESE